VGLFGKMDLGWWWLKALLLGIQLLLLLKSFTISTGANKLMKADWIKQKTLRKRQKSLVDDASILGRNLSGQLAICHILSLSYSVYGLIDILVFRTYPVSCTHGVTTQMPPVLVLIHQSTHDVIAHCQYVNRHYYHHARAQILDWQGLNILPRLPEPSNHLHLSQFNCQGLEYPLLLPFHLPHQVRHHHLGYSLFAFG
jgi:hypothetical protein